MKIFTGLIVYFFSLSLCFSQGFPDKKLKKESRYVSISFGVNANNYFGDLNSLSFANLTKTRRYRPGISFILEKKISGHTGLAAMLSWNRIAADDYYNADPQSEIFNYTRNLSFRNDILEFAGIVKYYFKKNDYTYAERADFSPYFFVGAGIFHNNPKGRIPEFTTEGRRFNNSGEWRALQPLGTEGQFSEGYDVHPYSVLQPVVPFGFGAEMKVNNNFSVNLEVCYRYIFTDYLDDVSGNYVDLGALDSDLARAFSDRSGDINSSNGRNPRRFDLINQFTDEKIYQSAYDGYQYEVLNGFGEEGMKRGGSNKVDFYLMAGIRLSYILSGKKEKR